MPCRQAPRTEHIGHYSREEQRRQLGMHRRSNATVVMTGATKRAAETRATDEQIDLLVYSSLGRVLPRAGGGRVVCPRMDGAIS